MLVVVKRNAPAWKEIWEEPQKIITRILKHLKYYELVSQNDNYDGSDCRFIAFERWDSHI